MHDVVLHLPAWLLPNESKQPHNRPEKLTIINLITGNPGLIGYYEPYLQLLEKACGDKAVIIGASLGGFFAWEGHRDDEKTVSLEDDFLRPADFAVPDVFSLQDQIKLCWKRLSVLVGRLQHDYELMSSMPIEMVLIGHSVGAYMALECVRLQDEARIVSDKSSMAAHIIATFLLTPTIVDISQSSSGKVATPVLSTLPFFPSLLQMGSNALTVTIPTSWLSRLVVIVTGMKNPEAINTTVTFLQQAGGVKQALTMAKYEMAEIGINKWSDEVLGALEVNTSKAEGSSAETWCPPKHYFLFAKEDHWVAQTTRQNIVASMQGRATIVIDDGDDRVGLVHAWCLEQNEAVAKITAQWLTELL